MRKLKVNYSQFNSFDESTEDESPRWRSLLSEGCSENEQFVHVTEEVSPFERISSQETIDTELGVANAAN